MLAVAAGLFALSALLLEPLTLWARIGLRLGLCAAFPLLLWLARFPEPEERKHAARLLSMIHRRER
jgi:hypothetical protein